jgi:ABC-2 type transport system ATP-binding protein
MEDGNPRQPAPDAPVLELCDVSKTYGKVVGLVNLSLSIGRGEFVSLMGPNGAGKTTLIQVAAGLFAPDRGTVRVFGETYDRDSVSILRRLGVVFQTRSLDLDMTVRANLNFYGNLFGLWGKPLVDRIAEATEWLQISDLLDRPVRALSGGNQRRVEIARALLNEPQLLLMDEPSAGLDQNLRNALVERMRRLCHEKGTAILWATHLRDDIELADRIVLLEAGALVLPGHRSTR